MHAQEKEESACEIIRYSWIIKLKVDRTLQYLGGHVATGTDLVMAEIRTTWWTA